MMQRMAQMKWNHPELKYMATEDLVALQAWTTDDYEVVQDVLEKEARPTAHGLAFANASFPPCTRFPKNIHIKGLSSPAKISCRTGYRNDTKKEASPRTADFSRPQKPRMHPGKEWQSSGKAIQQLENASPCFRSVRMSRKFSSLLAPAFR